MNFAEGTPLGLEEWMADTQCVLVLGDGNALNYARRRARSCNCEARGALSRVPALSGEHGPVTARPGCCP